MEGPADIFNQFVPQKRPREEDEEGRGAVGIHGGEQKQQQAKHLDCFCWPDSTGGCVHDPVRGWPDSTGGWAFLAGGRAS